MPVYIRKIRNKKLWKVYDKQGKVYSKGTTHKKALLQIKLLRGLAHGMVKR